MGDRLSVHTDRPKYTEHLYSVKIAPQVTRQCTVKNPAGFSRQLDTPYSILPKGNNPLLAIFECLAVAAEG